MHQNCLKKDDKITSKNIIFKIHLQGNKGIYFNANFRRLPDIYCFL